MGRHKTATCEAFVGERFLSQRFGVQYGAESNDTKYGVTHLGGISLNSPRPRAGFRYRGRVTSESVAAELVIHRVAN